MSHYYMDIWETPTRAQENWVALNSELLRARRYGRQPHAYYEDCNILVLSSVPWGNHLLVVRQSVCWCQRRTPQSFAHGSETLLRFETFSE